MILLKIYVWLKSKNIQAAVSRTLLVTAAVKGPSSKGFAASFIPETTNPVRYHRHSAHVCHHAALLTAISFTHYFNLCRHCFFYIPLITLQLYTCQGVGGATLQFTREVFDTKDPFNPTKTFASSLQQKGN